MFRTRVSALLAAFFFVAFALAPAAEAKKRARVTYRGGKIVRMSGARGGGVGDARYADIIMNPVTGEIYHSKDPDGIRYPASLTKMMTLYLLFEALEQKRTTLDARLDISQYATTMPQTNLSLTAGDSISVETCIKALVVRSANDVAVVVAEALAGDVDTFAEKMTAKARALGMSNTVFKNPNGLPNSGQHTTARDMAKLGIALKRDFPKYYRYFSTLSFSHDGVTYYTHNRVMLRYAGVDGIKTGFIGASGFNLVTSVVRGGRPLVGVVMGGASGGWRDNRMIELLDDSYQIIAVRGAAKGKNYPQNLPLARSANGKRVGMGVDVTSLTTEDSTPQVDAQAILQNSNAEGEDGGEQLPAATLPEEREAVRAESSKATPFDAAQVQQAAAVPETTAPTATYAPTTRPIVISTPQPARAPAARSKVIQLSSAPAPAAAPQASPFAVAQAPAKPPETAASPPAATSATVAPVAASTATAAKDGGWGIQVGAFSTQALAVSAARAAIQTAASPLVAAKMAMADPATGSVPVHRARLEGLTQANARKACELLIKANSPCFIYKVSQ